MVEAPLRVFYSYSHRDERMLERLQKHLSMLRRRGLITEWSDRAIEAGSEWRAEISRELEAANVILLLVSADFLASDFCWEEEMQVAVERSARGDAKVIAVMLRPVDNWEETPFAKLQVVPKDGRPISRWTDTELAFSDAAAKIRSAVQEHLTSLPGDFREQHREREQPDLDVDESLGARSAELQAALEELRTQAEGAYLIVIDPVRGYFTQFLGDETGFWCEAVSNEFLEPGDALDDDQLSRLASLGWRPPMESTPNWWYGEDARSAADVAVASVRALRDVYGVSLDKPFKLEKSWES